MKKFKFITLSLLIMSLIWCMFNVIDGVQKRDWVVTNAVIERIGLPDGAVFGTYKDQDGTIHSGELYISSFLQGQNANTEKYIGREIKIIYNPQTDKVSNYDNFMLSWYISVGLSVISGLVLCLLKRIKAE